jgi:hypothetical protein
MSTAFMPGARSWISAEVDLAEAKMVAVRAAMLSLDAVVSFLDPMQRQQARAMLDSLELARRRLETRRDEHEAALRKYGEADD